MVFLLNKIKRSNNKIGVFIACQYQYPLFTKYGYKAVKILTASTQLQSSFIFQNRNRSWYFTPQNWFELREHLGFIVSR